MPEGKKSILTRRVEKALDILERRYEKLRKEFEVPFGMEEVGGSEYKRRWQAMSEADRQLELQRLGLEKVRQLLLGGS